ncbi:MAG: hypothetical protein PHC70_03970 [Patescibacteria group bacterium]|nr:hypothetical protein [Patescibacteria group bacterium]
MPKKNTAEEALTKKALPNWLVVLIFVVGVAVGFGGFWLGWRYMNKEKQQVKIPAPIANNDNQPPENVSLPDLKTDLAPLSVSPEGQFNYVTSTQKIDNREISLSVSWLKTPYELSSEDTEIKLASLKLPEGAIRDKALDYVSGFHFDSLWKLGSVKNSEFAGYDLFLFRSIEEGMLPTYDDSYVILSEDNSDLRVIGRAGSFFLVDRMIGMPRASIDERVPSEVLTYQNGKKIKRFSTLSFWEDNTVYSFIDLKDTVFTHDSYSKEGFELLNGKGLKGSRVVILDDGQVKYYTSSIPGKETEDGGFTPAIEWNNVGNNNEKYKVTELSGCGGWSSVPNVVEVQNISDYSIVGETSEGEPVYFPKNPSANEFVQKAYDLWFLPDGQQKPNIDEFLKKYPRPIFLWKNAFGEWVLGQHQDLQPQVECGKPVIYLYPKETTNVSVALPRFINVTVSEPRYPVGGWKVTAKPDGTLNLLAASSTYATTTYGSLYWEGTGIGYVTPKDGFLVKNGEQKAFLSNILLKYGLNKKEAGEFMDFWLPKMTGAPYYRVSFLTNAWSQAAPLYVNPKPETSIRIFMDWQKLSTPIKITPPQIVTPTRNGFTLVEWGGLLYK